MDKINLVELDDEQKVDTRGDFCEMADQRLYNRLKEEKPEMLKTFWPAHIAQVRRNRKKLFQYQPPHVEFLEQQQGPEWESWFLKAIEYRRKRLQSGKQSAQSLDNVSIQK